MTEIIKKTAQKAKKGSVKIGKYKVGLPGSDSYKAKTPKALKIISEGLVAVGSVIGILTLPFHWPVTVGAIGSSLVIFGRFGIKCFSES